MTLSFPSSKELVRFEFNSEKEAEDFCYRLFKLNIKSHHPLQSKRPFTEEEKYIVILTSEESKKLYQEEDFLFTQEIRQAVHWSKTIFDSPYPYLTPWLDQTLPPTQGFCPKQLVRFETEMCEDNKKIVRPNHGMVHSIRVATYMPMVCLLFKKYSRNQSILSIVNDEKKIRLLQIMMLLSVSGRVNEAGRAGLEMMNRDERKLSYRNYEESRLFSAENLKKYYLTFGLPGISSTEEFEKCYHAMRYMEKADDSDHNWNSYIILMSLTHSMDLIRCFTPDIMKKLHKCFERYFFISASSKKEKKKIRKDIFAMLKMVELTQRLTGNRVITGIDENNQSYYPAGVSYNFNLFYECTHNIDYTMDQIIALHYHQQNHVVTIFLPELIGIDETNSVLFFECEQEAKLFANILYQNRMIDNPNLISVITSQDRPFFALSLKSSEMQSVQPFIHYKQARVTSHTDNNSHRHDALRLYLTEIESSDDSTVEILNTDGQKCVDTDIDYLFSDNKLSIIYDNSTVEVLNSEGNECIDCDIDDLFSDDDMGNVTKQKKCRLSL